MKLYIRTPHDAFFERCPFCVRLYSPYFGAEKNKAVYLLRIWSVALVLGLGFKCTHMPSPWRVFRNRIAGGEHNRAGREKRICTTMMQSTMNIDDEEDVFYEEGERDFTSRSSSSFFWNLCLLMFIQLVEFTVCDRRGLGAALRL